MATVREVTVTLTTTVTVYAESDAEALDAVKEMYLSGDACADPGKATYQVVRDYDDMDEEG